jgi:Ca2+-binding RTX toxin-like protein
MESQFKENNINNSINFKPLDMAQEDKALNQYTINSSIEGSGGNDTLVATFGYVDGYWGYDVLIADYSNYETAIENIDYKNYIRRINDNVDLLSFDSIENYYITGTKFNDSLQANANDSLDGGEGKDRLSLDFYSVTESVLIDLTNNDNQVTFADTLVKNFETIETIYGSSNDDKIKLSSSASSSGGYIDGSYGYDTLILDYSSYETAIENVDYNNYIRRIDNNETLIYFDSIEHYQITATAFNDSLQGSTSSDTLIGGSGDDFIAGNANDSLDGGEGKDRLSLDFYSVTESVLIDLTNSDNQVTFADTLIKNFETIETIYGSSNDDKIKLGLAAFSSGGYIDGFSGYDTLILDYSSYETAIENIDYNNYIRRIDNNETLIYFDSIEHYQITATAFNDSLQGSTLSDTLIGSSGDDFIAGNANDSLDGGEGRDKLSLDFSTATESVLIDLTNSDNQVTFADTLIKNFETIETIQGGSYDDKIKLGLAASANGGEVDGLYGNDLLILDYSSYETAIENVNYDNYVNKIDNNETLIYYANIEHYQITATAFNDSLQGSILSDTLIGGSGNDFITGNSGKDILIGVNYNSENAGIGEIDTLVGGTNKDRFVLGNAEQVFYNNQFDDKFNDTIAKDYALIQNFDSNEDIINLSGSKDSYFLAASPVENILGTAIYKIKDNSDRENHELIAIVENVTGLNIDSDIFKNITKNSEEPKIEYSTAHQKCYQMSRLAVGFNVSNSEFSALESELVADKNQDGLISAFDAYLTYFS